MLNLRDRELTLNSMSSEAKRVAIVQSNYLPWIGYFDLINSVDKFIFLDDVQYTSRDWRNRNKIITPEGLKWITIPVANNSNPEKNRISDVRFASSEWKQQHLEIIKRNYSKSPYFNEHFSIFSEVYSDESTENLSKFNQMTISKLCKFMGIETELLDSSNFQTEGTKSEKLLELCLSVGATTYVSGAAAKVYLDTSLFLRNGISVEWFEYGYKNYPQLWGFEEQKVSIVDPIMNIGGDCLAKIKVT